MSKTLNAKKRTAGSASWSKAEMHFGMAKAAWKLAARNEHGAAMVIEHMERAVETLKAMPPNDKSSATAAEEDK